MPPPFPRVGFLVGIGEVGALVGAIVGFGVGANVGFGVGATVGFGLGAGVGVGMGRVSEVGFGVGAFVGAGVGFGVGALVGVLGCAFTVKVNVSLLPNAPPVWIVVPSKTSSYEPAPYPQQMPSPQESKMVKAYSF